MALPNPEGKCVMVRAPLRNDVNWGGTGPPGSPGEVANPLAYIADNPTSFYRSFLLDYIWNAGYNTAVPFHPRSDYVKSTIKGKEYNNFTHLTISYGPAPNKINSQAQHNLCINGSRLKKRVDGGAAESWYMQMPMPTREERWMFIDMVANIRGIYVPVAQQANEQYPSICTFVHVNFTLNASQEIWRPGRNGWHTAYCNNVFGLTSNKDLTLGIDVQAFTELLTIPEELRKVDLYTGKILQIFERSEITIQTFGPPQPGMSFGPFPSQFSDSHDFEFTKILEWNTGLKCSWKQPITPGGSWGMNFLKNVFTIAFSFVPGIGPVLSAAFAVGFDLAVNPSAAYDTLKAVFPLVDASDYIIRDIQKSAANVKDYIDPRFINSIAEVQSIISKNDATVLDMGEYFAKAAEVLAASGTKDNGPKGGNESNPSALGDPKESEEATAAGTVSSGNVSLEET